MANYFENFRGGSDNAAALCIVCKMHIDSFSHAVNCDKTLKLIKSRGNINEIFTQNVSRETAMLLEEITEVRKQKCKQLKLSDNIHNAAKAQVHQITLCDARVHVSFKCYFFDSRSWILDSQKK